MYLIRRELINKIATDLTLINEANGYNNTLVENNINIGILPQSSIRDFPYVSVEMGTEVQINSDESGRLVEREADIYVCISLNTSDVRIIETYIEDIKTFFMVYNSDVLPTIDLSTVKYVNAYTVQEVSPIIDRIKNFSQVFVLLKVKYTDVMDDYTLTRIVDETGKYIIAED